jgi:hypothetical protein
MAKADAQVDSAVREHAMLAALAILSAETGELSGEQREAVLSALQVDAKHVGPAVSLVSYLRLSK